MVEVLLVLVGCKNCQYWLVRSYPQYPSSQRWICNVFIIWPPRVLSSQTKFLATMNYLTTNTAGWSLLHTFIHFYSVLIGFIVFISSLKLSPWSRPAPPLPRYTCTRTNGHINQAGLGFFYWILKLEACCQMIQHTQRHPSNWESIINTSFSHNYPGYRVHYGAKTVSSVTHTEKLISFLRTCL